MPYVSIHSATNLIACVRFRLKQMWRLTKAMTKMKLEHWTKRWNWSWCRKLALSAIWAHGLIAQQLRASKRDSVVVGSNHFLQLLLNTYLFSFIPIYSHLSLGAWFSAPSSSYSYEIWPVLAADIKETEKIIKENDENI